MVGSASIGTCEQVAEFRVPLPRADVAQHRAAGVGHVGGERRAARQVPDQPGIDRADAARGRRRRGCRDSAAATRSSCRRSTGRAPGPCARGPTGDGRRSELVAACGGAAVLPHDRGAVGLAGRTVPGEHRLALVGDADRRDTVDADLADDLRSVRAIASQISIASCSTQPGCGKCCVNSSYSATLGEPSANTARLRTPVVPASRAMTQSRSVRAVVDVVVRSVGRRGGGRGGRRAVGRGGHGRRM